jgi:hypothetical protein
MSISFGNAIKHFIIATKMNLNHINFFNIYCLNFSFISLNNICSINFLNDSFDKNGSKLGSKSKFKVYQALK